MQCSLSFLVDGFQFRMDGDKHSAWKKMPRSKFGRTFVELAKVCGMDKNRFWWNLGMVRRRCMSNMRLVWLARIVAPFRSERRYLVFQERCRAPWNEWILDQDPHASVQFDHTCVVHLFLYGTRLSSMLHRALQMRTTLWCCYLHRSRI